MEAGDFVAGREWRLFRSGRCAGGIADERRKDNCAFPQSAPAQWRARRPAGKDRDSSRERIPCATAPGVKRCNAGPFLSITASRSPDWKTLGKRAARLCSPRVTDARPSAIARASRWEPWQNIVTSLAPLKISRALNLDGGSSSAFWCRTKQNVISVSEFKTVRDFVALSPRN